MSCPLLTYRYEALSTDREDIRQLVASTGVFSAVEIDVAVELVDDRLQRGVQSDYRFLFAEQNGRLIGYTCYGPISLTQSSYDLYWIAVDKTLQGHKIGQTLLARTEQLVFTEGGRHLYAETSNRADYAPTRGFYRRCGYVQEALLKDFYATGDDKVIFGKALSG